MAHGRFNSISATTHGDPHQLLSSPCTESADGGDTRLGRWVCICISEIDRGSCAIVTPEIYCPRRDLGWRGVLTCTTADGINIAPTAPDQPPDHAAVDFQPPAMLWLLLSVATSAVSRPGSLHLPSKLLHQAAGSLAGWTSRHYSSPVRAAHLGDALPSGFAKAGTPAGPQPCEGLRREATPEADWWPEERPLRSAQLMALLERRRPCCVRVPPGNCPTSPYPLCPGATRYRHLTAVTVGTFFNLRHRLLR